MTAATPIVPALTELKVRADAPLDIDFFDLPSNAALCIGLTIDPRHAKALHACALRHTQPDEHARAARFLRSEDSLRHLTGRMLLRVLATRYGSMPPNQAIPVNAWGKPDLSAYGIGCNISHAGSQVWAALTRVPQVGIDVESAIASTDFQDTIASFHPDEIAMLRTASDPQSAMIRCWCRKEAVSKATGLGLSLPLDAYAVDCGTTQAGWLRRAPTGGICADWTTTDLPVVGDYVAALAVKGRCDAVHVLQLQSH